MCSSCFKRELLFYCIDNRMSQEKESLLERQPAPCISRQYWPVDYLIADMFKYILNLT